MTVKIECEICGKYTPMLGTKLCDRCWELKTRITRDLRLAEKIISSIKEEKREEMIYNLRTAARSVFLAADEDIAQDLANKLNAAANMINTFD